MMAKTTRLTSTRRTQAPAVTRGKVTKRSDRQASHTGKTNRRRIRTKSPVCAVSVSITEESVDGRECATRTLRIPLRSVARRAPKSGRHADSSRILLTSAECDTLAAVGHPVRARLLRFLLDGPATYKALRTDLQLAAGPLYHHINQLRLSGLILPKSRDLYELSRGGRNLLAVALAVAKLAQDRRRRPVNHAIS